MIKGLLLLIFITLTSFKSYSRCLHKGFQVSNTQEYKINGQKKTLYRVTSYDLQFDIEPNKSQLGIVKNALRNHLLIDILLEASCNREFDKRETIGFSKKSITRINYSKQKKLNCDQCEILINPPLVYNFPGKEKLIQFLIEKDILRPYPARQAVKEIFKIILDMNFQKEIANSSILSFVLLKVLAHNGVKSITGKDLSHLSTLLSSNFTKLEINFMNRLFTLIREFSIELDRDDLLITLFTKNGNDIKILPKDLPLEKGTDLMNRAEIFFNHVTINNGLTLKFLDIQNIRDDGKFEVEIDGVKLVAGFYLGHLKAKGIDVDIKSDTPLMINYSLNYFPMTQKMDY